MSEIELHNNELPEEEIIEMEMTGGAKELFMDLMERSTLAKLDLAAKCSVPVPISLLGYMTTGGLTKKDLVLSHGRIVSKKKHLTAKKEKRLRSTDTLPRRVNLVS